MRGETTKLVSLTTIIVGAVGILLLGILAPIGLKAMESYTPSDATQAIIWPLIGTFFMLGIGLAFILQALKGRD
jgi:fumarate reductase subunit D